MFPILAKNTIKVFAFVGSFYLTGWSREFFIAANTQAEYNFYSSILFFLTGYLTYYAINNKTLNF